MKKSTKTFLFNSALLFFGMCAEAVCETDAVAETPALSKPDANTRLPAAGTSQDSSKKKHPTKLADNPNAIVDGSLATIVLPSPGPRAKTIVMVEDHAPDAMMPSALLRLNNKGTEAILEGNALIEEFEKGLVSHNINLLLKRKNTEQPWTAIRFFRSTPEGNKETLSLIDVLNQQVEMAKADENGGAANTDAGNLIDFAKRVLSLAETPQEPTVGASQLFQTDSGIFNGVVTNPDSKTLVEVRVKGDGDEITAKTIFTGKGFPQGLSTLVELDSSTDPSDMSSIEDLVDAQWRHLKRTEAGKYLASLPLKESQEILTNMVAVTLYNLHSAASPQSAPPSASGQIKYKDKLIVKPFSLFSPDYPVATLDKNGQAKMTLFKDVTANQAVSLISDNVVSAFKDYHPTGGESLVPKTTPLTNG